MTSPCTEVQFVLVLACILDVNQRVNDPFRYSWEIFVTGFMFVFRFYLW